LSNHEVIGLSSAQVSLGAFRVAALKPALYGVLLILALGGVALAARGMLESASGTAGYAGRAGWCVWGAGLLALIAAAFSPKLLEYMTFQRFTLDANHFWVSGVVIGAAGLAGFVLPPGAIRRLLSWTLVVAIAAGALMLAGVWWVAYSVFDGAVVVLAATLLIQTAVWVAGGEESRWSPSVILL